ANLAAVGEARAPGIAVALRGKTFGTREYGGAARARVHRVDDDEPRIVDAAVGIDEAVAELRLQSRPVGRSVQAHGLGPWQARTPRQMVVKKEAAADHPARAQLRHMRHDEARRPHQMARDIEQHLALGERLGHEAKLEALEIAQSAVDQLA